MIKERNHQTTATTTTAQSAELFALRKSVMLDVNFILLIWGAKLLFISLHFRINFFLLLLLLFLLPFSLSLAPLILLFLFSQLSMCESFFSLLFSLCRFIFSVSAAHAHSCIAQVPSILTNSLPFVCFSCFFLSFLFSKQNSRAREKSSSNNNRANKFIFAGDAIRSSNSLYWPIFDSVVWNSHSHGKRRALSIKYIHSIQTATFDKNTIDRSNLMRPICTDVKMNCRKRRKQRRERLMHNQNDAHLRHSQWRKVQMMKMRD